MKRFVSISVVLLLIFSLAVIPAFAADKPLLVDDMNVLSESEAAEVEARLQEISDKYNMDFVIVTTDNLEGKTKQEFADDYYDYNGYGEGRRGDRSGSLLLVYFNGSGTERWISTRGYGITCFTDYGIQHIGSVLVPIMDKGEWSEAFLEYADLCSSLTDMAEEGKPLDVDNAPKTSKDIIKGVVISLIVGLVIAFVVKGMVKSKYKPVHFKPDATDYLAAGSLNLTGSYDNYRTSSVTRTVIESRSSGGSSTHTSSSGASHGGGGF